MPIFSEALARVLRLVTIYAVVVVASILLAADH